MLEEIAGKYNIQAVIFKLPGLCAILLQHLHAREGMKLCIWVQVHGKLAAARHGVNELTPPASQIQNCCLRWNPPGEESAKNYPHAFSIVTAPGEAGLIKLLQVCRGMGFNAHDDLADVVSNSQVRSGIANHPPQTKITL